MEDSEYPDGVFVKLWNGVKVLFWCLLLVVIVGGVFYFDQ